MSFKMLLFFLPFSLAAIPKGSCPETSSSFFGHHPDFAYDPEVPDTVFELPEILKEVSGLSLTAGGKRLAAIDDEKGVIFLLDKTTGQIAEEINFWEDGDYEGIEIVGDDAFAVKSNGSLYRIKNYASPDRQTEKFTSFLNKENDVEGLAYDAKNNRLLLGCKGKGVDGDGSHLKKAIYAFDLKTMALQSEPAFMLSLSDVQHFLEHYTWEEGRKKLAEMFSPETKEMKFNPSGIAVHPISGDVYVTSSTGKMLLVFSPKNEILFLEKLDKKIHTQPEGLCFDADGTLYISNEAKDEAPARIYKFRYRK